MGALFSGTYRADNDRAMVEIEAVRERNGERWKVIARCAGARCEAYSDAPDPTPTIWRLIGEALDSKAEAAPPKWDLNRKFKKPTPVRRRLATGLPPWRPPNDAA
jgi:hypothetical protein